MPNSTEWIVAEEMGTRMRLSGEYVVLEDHWIPEVLEIESGGDGDPMAYARVEVSEAGPKLVELRFTSPDPDAGGIRQTDLRDVQVSSLLEDFVAMWTVRVERDDSGAVLNAASSNDDEVFRNNLRMVGRLRLGHTTRDITPQLLERVAKVYRDNISGTPTKAVQHHFQVSQRMAAEYVSRARKRGLLPPTKRGKKQA